MIITAFCDTPQKQQQVFSFLTNAVAGDTIVLNNNSVFVKAGTEWFNNITNDFLSEGDIRFLVKMNSII